MNYNLKYNSNIHHRRSIRLKGYDYSQAGLYFITICCQDRICRFGHVEYGKMILNEYGQIAHDEWLKLSKRFTNFELDVFQIMPNHMHGIIALNAVGATLAVAPDDTTVAPNTQNDDGAHGDAVAPDHATVAPDDTSAAPDETPVDPIDPVVGDDIGARTSPTPTWVGSISDIVGAYKSLVANACLDIYKTKNKTMGKLWQRNYYEHIIRNDKSYHTISEYIINNPKKWPTDKFYKK